MLTTPTLWRSLLDSGWEGQPGLKMISRGETLSWDLADALLQRGAELWNQYGTTETTICVTTEQVVQDDCAPTIGRPIRNARVYVLDARGEPVPVGVAGELWVAGVQVARGYLNRLPSSPSSSCWPGLRGADDLKSPARHGF
jgi:non-ribosomal peptide synthetase component F